MNRGLLQRQARHSANDELPPVTFARQMLEKRQASTAQLKADVAKDRLHALRGLTVDLITATREL